MSTGKENWLQRYLDGELSEEEERQALHQIADDPEMRALLKFDLLLRQDLGSDFRINQVDRGKTDSVPGFEESREKIAIPDSFFDGVMNAISQKDSPFAAGTDRKSDLDAAPVSGPSAGDDHGSTSLWDWIWQPRPVMLRPAWSAGIAAVFLLLLIGSPYFVTTVEEPDMTREIPVRQIVEETTDRVMMRFVYVDSDAETIAVAGDFSDWEPITLSRQTINGDVAWTGIIPLPRGEHRYMFIKDGEQWATDPLASRFVDDGFGNKNAVVSL